MIELKQTSSVREQNYIPQHLSNFTECLNTGVLTFCKCNKHKGFFENQSKGQIALLSLSKNILLQSKKANF